VIGVLDAATALEHREVSSRELVGECLARIGADTTGAWIRVYADAAHAAAAAADERRAAGGAPLLCGIPIGLKDLYAAAGVPLTASSELLHEIPDVESIVERHENFNIIRKNPGGPAEIARELA